MTRSYPKFRPTAGRILTPGQLHGGSRYGSYSTIAQRQQVRMDRTGWTGCSCGSLKGHPRASDCAECRHDY